MNMNQLMEKATRVCNNARIVLKRNSPKILLIGGIAGIGVGTVLACKATLKVNDVLAEKNDTIQKIHDTVESDPDKYTQEDAQSDLTKVYISTAVQMAKIYAPAAAVIATSIACIVKSNSILQKRNLALAAAYASVDKTLKDYRKRVVDRFGQEVDHELRYNIVTKDVETPILDDDGNPTGDTVIEKKKVIVDNKPSGYAKFFDEYSFGWDKNPEINLRFLLAQQACANKKLITRGYLFLNEVYRDLGLPETIAGQSVGWIYDEDNPVGDNVVDFGIYNINRPASREFVNGYERSILLDFNVDGDILTILKERNRMIET